MGWLGELASGVTKASGYRVTVTVFINPRHPASSEHGIISCDIHGYYCWGHYGLLLWLLVFALSVTFDCILILYNSYAMYCPSHIPHTTHVFFLARKHDHVMPLLHELHWLQMPQQMKYKLPLNVSSLSACLSTDVPRRRSTLCGRRWFTTVPAVGFDAWADNADNAIFHRIAPSTCNNLLADVTSSLSL